MSKKSCADLFLELAKPDEETGISRWVDVNEFVYKYSSLKLGNGFSWGRRSSQLAKKYVVQTKKEGGAIKKIRLCGYNTNDLNFNQAIRKDIKDKISAQKCVMLGVRGNTENTKIEVDHKNGRKNDLRVSCINTQKESDFQPLCKAANDIKRQICKKCKETNKRWDAKNIKGNPYSFYDGGEEYDEKLGCEGCYQYDPVKYRIESAKKLSKECCNTVIRKIYPEIESELL